MTQTVKAYSMLTTPTAGTTNTGLDQIVSIINTDPGLAGANLAASIVEGAAAANGITSLIVDAIKALNLGSNGVFSAADVVAINTYIRGDAARLTAFTAFHGNDEDGVETGFHTVQNDGATGTYRGDNVIDTVADSLFHIGFAINADNRFVNEDGNANATVEQVANWLTQFYTDHSTTGTGLDRTTDLIMADRGLSQNQTEDKIEKGADAANVINGLITSAIKTLGLGQSGVLTVDDVKAINGYIQNDADRKAAFTAAHGDDEGGVETGFHDVQGDGGSAVYFGRNLINTVLDGIYHIGFQIQGERFLNEDGNANATVSDVADWLTYFYSDQSTTGTGLDRIVDTIKVDTGLARNTNAGQINAGAAAANGLNTILADKIVATKATSDGWVDVDDLRAINASVRSDSALYQKYIALHGDDEDGVETGFHLVQGDGATTNYLGKNLVNSIADSIYHFGFEIINGHYVNEDGNQNATVEDVSAWVNYFYTGKTVVMGTNDADTITGGSAGEQFVGESGNDTIDAGGGDDLLYGGFGNDTLAGGSGKDILYGGGGNDAMDGGEDADVYRVSGNEASGWASFQGYDTYADTGTSGVDRIEAVGDSDVDIGLASFGPASGIEVIDATRAVGTVRLLGDWKANTLDFSGTQLVGANIVIDGGNGADTITGSAGADIIIGGLGDDKMDGGLGGDVYQIRGTLALGWSSFNGYDTYQDSGSELTDTIQAIGSDNVDIGLTGFLKTNGIDVIDALGAKSATLLGDWKGSTFDFSNTVFKGTVIIDAGSGSDTVIGNSDDNVIFGGGGADFLDGAGGNDTYRVTGNFAAGWSSFQDFDTYRDSGASTGDRIEAVGTGDVDIGLKQFDASSGIEFIQASNIGGVVRLLGDYTGNVLNFAGTTFLGGKIIIDGGQGNDTITGNAGDNSIIGGGGNDAVDGGNGSDTYLVSGNLAGGSMSFQGYDTYADTGTTGTDTILAVGTDTVDVGMTRFDASSGIEIIDGSGISGDLRLLGDWNANTLDFSATQFKGKVVIDGAGGADTITGNAADNIIIGGTGADTLDGAGGDDTYRVSGNYAAGWSSFQDFDTYRDTGNSKNDAIEAVGSGDVDIGLKQFDATNGIEFIKASNIGGVVRLLGDGGANTLNFAGTTFVGAKIIIDGGSGADTITGNAGDNIIVGGNGNDLVDGGNGSDIYQISGSMAGGSMAFQGYDTYADKGTVGTDTIQTIGIGDVDVGLTRFDATSGIEIIDGSGITGVTRLLGDWNANMLDFSTTQFKGNVVIDGAGGADTIIGNAGDNIIIGGTGADTLDGAGGNDTYRVSGVYTADWSSFQDFDTYRDTGVSKGDMIEAVGTGNVDIGLKQFDATNGIEIIKASNTTGVARLLGDNNANVLNFAGTTFIGSKIIIDGGYGADTITGNAGDNIIVGGGGNDTVDGGNGSDTYQVSGILSGGWSSFQDYDTYADKGTVGTDTIQAMGTGNVDVGLIKFDVSSGIEVVDGTGISGVMRLLGDWTANTLDFRTVTFKGNVVIDGAGGNDVIKGTSGNDVIVGGTGQDNLDGGAGNDTYQVTGNFAAGWGSFSDYDTYNDTGVGGQDVIQAIGTNVDIGFNKVFGSTSGIETIDASLATGTTRLLGSSSDDKLDFSGVTLKGGTFLMDGGEGNDEIKGTAGADRITGGSGNDTLTGGAGNDMFLFRNALSKSSNVDKITDFSVPGDTIQLSMDIFKNAGPLGTLASAAFQIGAKANDAFDRIIYDSTDGSLYYDADGTGSTAQILFATVSKGLPMTNADFVIV